MTGRLGVTWGGITSRVADGPIRFGQFIAVWRREADGRVRFITDGGNSRPPS